VHAQPVEHWYTLWQPRPVYAPPAAGHDPMQAALLGSSEDGLMLPRTRRRTSTPSTDVGVAVTGVIISCAAPYCLLPASTASMLPPAMEPASARATPSSATSRKTHTLLSMVPIGVVLHMSSSRGQLII
jgi:hypothetical protein